LILLPIFTLLAWIGARLPARFRLAHGDALGWVFRRAKFRAAIIEQNLKFAFPNDLAKQARLKDEAYRHFGRLCVEIFFLFGPWKRFVAKNTTLEGFEHWQRAAAKGKGVILLANHVGNWEVMSACGAQHGMQPMIVTKHLKPEWLHQAIIRGRAKCGLTATYEPKTFRDVLKWLKAGKTIGFVLDQYAGPPVGIRVPFFGVPVGTHSAVAIIAKRTGAPVLPVGNRRRPDGKFDVEVHPEITWIQDPDPDRETALNTARFAEIMEEHVRRCPEQWLWIHRRFKGDLTTLRPNEWSSGRKYSRLGKS